LLPASPKFLDWLILRPWKWREYVAPKCWLTFNGLHGVISRKLNSSKKKALFLLSPPPLNVVSLIPPPPTFSLSLSLSISLRRNVEGSQNRQTAKCGHGSCGTRNCVAEDQQQFNSQSLSQSLKG
jgi:hypothetical protein